MEPETQSGAGHFQFFCELFGIGVFAGQHVAGEFGERLAKLFGDFRVGEQSAEKEEQAAAKCGKNL